MGRFQGMKVYATKICKFRQGKVINREEHSGHLDDDQLELLDQHRGGVCAAMSARWLKKRQWYSDTKQDWARRALLKGLVTQHEYTEAHDIEVAFNRHGIRPRDVEGFWGTSRYNKNIGDHVREWKNCDRRIYPKAYISFSVNGAVTGSHGVAMAKGIWGWEFFDPNCGLYHIHSGLTDDFFDAYQNAYQNIGLNIFNINVQPVRT